MWRPVLGLPILAIACANPPSDTPAAPAQRTAALSDDDAGVSDDPYLWLEEVQGERALNWVREQNAKSQAALETDEQRALQTRLQRIYDSQDRLPYVTKHGAYLYNFWQDEQHSRGLWRRTTLEEYRKPEPAWEVLVDFDALATSENENWVYSGATWLQPSHDRVLFSLSRGGGDAVVVREYDVIAKAFVADGFVLPEAKSDVSWKDHDTIYVGTDFGAGSLTTSGYPRITKEWKRGTPLSAAVTLYEGQPGDVGVFAYRDWHQGQSVDVVQRLISFYEAEYYLVDDGKLSKLDKPGDADVSFFRDFVLFLPRAEWTHQSTVWPAGSLLAAPLAGYRAGSSPLQAVFTPTPNRSLSSFSGTLNTLLLNVLEDVQSKLLVARSGPNGWSQTELPAEALTTIDTSAYDDSEGDAYWSTIDGYIAPARLALGDATAGTLEAVRTAPAFFDASGLEASQHFAVSKDGTRVPYFQVGKKDLQLDGNNPVLLTGYGGFEISYTPSYSAGTGSAWLERGGVFVQANIRGGGEYGPAWHQAALKHNRQRGYDDFIAIGEDLIARKVTQPKRLGIEGGSNGGLLMGVMLTQRPDLWGGVVCSAPLLDMKRYHLLLAGASWIGEYGDPDKPEDWAAIAQYSPYQNVKPGVQYPRVLFTGSTLDDRVHPGHARKMAARMLDLGYEVLFYENTEGGHAGAANNAQRAYVNALEYAYLYQQLKL